MKHWFVLFLAGILLLGGCSGQPVGTTAPSSVSEPEITAPSQTTSPTTEPEETTVPPTTTEPAETTVPTETTVPVFTSYTIQVTDPEQLIYEQPGFRHRCTASFGEAGTYTIIEEATDSDGNLWGRLKSGIGWVCLTEPPIVPVIADYAPEHFEYDHSWHCGESDYVTDIGIIPMEPIANVTFSLLNVIEHYQVDEVLYSIDALDAEETVLLSVVYWGDMTTYGLSFTDAAGNERYYALSVSGKDGSLICSEYTP